jgi:sialate O-acetylesterase
MPDLPACAAALSLTLGGALPSLELPSIFADHMVLQRESSVPIWGRAEPGATVGISFRGHEAAVVADASGAWRAQVPTGTAGGPFTLDVSAGSQQRRIADVLVGEVWIAGGQSNMWWHLDTCAEPAATAARAAASPSLRLFDANTSPQQSGYDAETPQTTVAATWVVADPATLGAWPGTPLYFAQRLQAALQVPVGIVHVAVPGQGIERFMRQPLLEQHFPTEMPAYEMAKARHEGRTPDDGKKPPRPAGLWNGTVAPCVPFAGRGFIWWQGEHNARLPYAYVARFAALIADWRAQWQMPDAPFLAVELANFGTRPNQPVEDAPWPALRDAQQRTCLLLHRVHTVSGLDIMDIDEEGGPWQIHPAHKERAGTRLAALALAEVYARPQPDSHGPRITAARFADGRAELQAGPPGVELRQRGQGPIGGFALAGSDGVWHRAQVEVAGTRIVLRSPAVPVPVAARHAWANNPQVDVIDAQGQPLNQWRSDDWLLWPR